MKLQPPPKVALLACSVFEREIAFFTRGAEHIVETRWFEMGLHGRARMCSATKPPAGNRSRRVFNQDGGFVCNAVHNIQGNSPIENVLAMFKAIHDSGKS